jgi:hypothetical protein
VAADLSWTACDALGWIRPRWAKGKVALAFVAFFFTSCRIDRAVFGVSGQNCIRFSFFSIFWESRIISKLAQS